MKETLSWKQLASIEVGGAICLPVIMVGHTIYHKYGLPSACLAIAAGNSFLLMIAYLSAVMSFESKLPTTDNAVHYFGRFGAKGFASALLFSKTCWFGLQLNMMVLSLESVFPGLVPKVIWECTLGFLILSGALFGIKGLSLLSAISMPLLIGTMGAAAYMANGQMGGIDDKPIVLTGISIIVAAAITAVVDMPTYFRHARTKQDSLLATLLFLGIAVPLVEGLGVYLSFKNSNGTIIESLQRSDAFGWNLWICAFFILAGWTTNNTNLYSGMTSLGTLCPKLNEKKRIVIVGLAGLTLSLLQILDHFTVILQIIGVIVGSMGCTVLIRYFYHRIGCRYMATELNQKRLFLIWFGAASLGFLSLGRIVQLTTIPLVDACLAAGTLTSLVSLFTYEGEYGHANK
jgi:purine-cytosine permease-like protein